MQKKARQRLLDAAYGAAGVLIEVSNDKNAPEGVRVQAANSILDRTGHGPKQQVEVEVRRYEKLLEGGELVIDADVFEEFRPEAAAIEVEYDDEDLI